MATCSGLLSHVLDPKAVIPSALPVSQLRPSVHICAAGLLNTRQLPRFFIAFGRDRGSCVRWTRACGAFQKIGIAGESPPRTTKAFISTDAVFRKPCGKPTGTLSVSPAPMMIAP